MSQHVLLVLIIVARLPKHPTITECKFSPMVFTGLPYLIGSWLELVMVNEVPTLHTPAHAIPTLSLSLSHGFPVNVHHSKENTLYGEGTCMGRTPWGGTV